MIMHRSASHYSPACACMCVCAPLHILRVHSILRHKRARVCRLPARRRRGDLLRVEGVYVSFSRALGNCEDFSFGQGKGFLVRGNFNYSWTREFFCSPGCICSLAVYKDTRDESLEHNSFLLFCRGKVRLLAYLMNVIRPF